MRHIQYKVARFKAVRQAAKNADPHVVAVLTGACVRPQRVNVMLAGRDSPNSVAKAECPSCRDPSIAATGRVLCIGLHLKWQTGRFAAPRRASGKTRLALGDSAVEGS